MADAVAPASAVPSAINRGALLGEGGEGRIYAVDGHPGLALKVYHAPLSAAKAAKIQALTARAPIGQSRFAAWPMKVLTDKSGALSAVLMPRVEAGKDIHLLYSPKARRQHFPRADWEFLVLVAQNLAGAFANVHALDCVIGDVNHGSVLVQPDAQVTLIDCDSFQIKVDGRTYGCEVAVPTFTPPELQGRDLAGRERSANHDAFGLAVLIFHLLFMGRHPFAGRPLTQADVPIEQAIKEHRFAFSSDRSRVRLEPPPHTLPLAAVSPEIAEMFERAFGPGATRPSAADWNAALGRLRAGLARCQAERSHAYVSSLGACPWCELEAQTGAKLFWSPNSARALRPPLGDELGVALVQALWRDILKAPRPVVTALPPPWSFASRCVASPGAARVAALASRAKAISTVAALITVAGATLTTPQLIAAWLVVGAAAYWVSQALLASAVHRMRSMFGAAHQAAKVRWSSLATRWAREAGPDSFSALLALLDKLRQEHGRLAGEVMKQRQRRSQAHQVGVRRWTGETSRRAQQIRSMCKLSSVGGLSDGELISTFDAQLKAYLDRHSIAKAAIPDIGPSRVAKLVSFGIETAADVDQAKLRAVPGFGPSYSKRLIDWRRGVERAFRFDLARAKNDIATGRISGSQPPAVAPIEAVDENTLRRLRAIESELSMGVIKLEQLEGNASGRVESLLKEARAAASELAQTEVDARASGALK